MTLKSIIEGKLKGGKGVPTEEEVHQAWLKELDNWEAEFYQYGLDDGATWAEEASEEELEYAVGRYVPMSRMPAVRNHEPTTDPIMGSYFEGVFEEYEHRGLKYDETGPNSRVPNGLWQQWEKGFLEAVRKALGQCEKHHR